jgi:DNA-binding winged helix-turn-helix (wHTH) protein/tetratricopeptide (TPR) repeat protein
VRDAAAGGGAGATGGLRFRFGAWELDESAGLLLHAGAVVRIRAKALALLAHLVRHRDRVVPKQELLDAVWPGLSVSDATLASTLSAVRAVLDDGRGRPIETLRGRGCRFVLPVEEVIPQPLRGLAAGDPAGSAAAEQVFVGRRELLAAGERWLEEVAAGSGRAALFAGEAGIGKSRSLFELARRAATRGFAVHVGRCSEEEGAPAYWPWMQVLRSVDESLAAAERDTCREQHLDAFALLPEVDSGNPAPSEETEGAALRFRRFDAVARLLRELARRTPRALVLDDLHRADASSAGMLRYLLGTIADVPILVVGGLRDREVPPDHPLEAVLAELHGVGHRVDLHGLEVREVGELAASISGRAPSLAVAGALHTRTRGNPLFVVEIARQLAQREALDDPAAIEREAPRSLRQVIRTRIAALPEPAERVLEVASVFGREFPFDALCAVCEGLAAERVEGALGAALRAELVEESAREPGRFRFAHILVRDVLYQELPREQRTGLHRAVGLALEALRPLARDEHADELAHHFGQAAASGEAARAVTWARRAGERALHGAAYGEAARLFASALRALDLRAAGRASGSAAASDRREQTELLLMLGRARWLGGGTEQGREAFTRAAGLAREARDAEMLARAALGFAGRTDATPGVNREAVALLEEALAGLPSADAALRAELLARLGTELYYEAGGARADALTAKALAVAERLGDGALLSYALSARHYALLRADVDPRQRLALAERLVELAGATGARDVLALGLQQSLVDLLERGDVDHLDHTLRRYDEVAETLRQPFFRWMCGAFQGMRALLGGDLAQAEILARKTLTLGQALGTPNALPVFAAQLFCLRREQGRVAEIEPLVRAAADEQPVFTALRAGLASLYAECGRRREARDAVEQVMARDLEDVPRDMHWITVLATLAGACAWLGDADRSRQLHALLTPYAGRLVCVGHGAACDGAVDHHLGLLAAACGDPDAADAHFDAALALERRAHAPLWTAHTQREWARLLWKGGAPHEREKARGLAREAGGTYGRLGLLHQVERTRRALH